MAVRIVGVDLPVEKKVNIGLTAIYGIGRKNVEKILETTKVDPDKRVRDLTTDEAIRLQKEMEKLLTEGKLRGIVSENIKRLRTIGTYRGMRHTAGLPARGQRTRSNARTKRGKRRTIGALRKKDMGKLGAQRESKEKAGAKE